MSLEEDKAIIKHVLASPDADAVDGTTTYCVGCGTCVYGSVFLK